MLILHVLLTKDGMALVVLILLVLQTPTTMGHNVSVLIQGISAIHGNSLMEYLVSISQVHVQMVLNGTVHIVLLIVTVQLDFGDRIANV